MYAVLVRERTVVTAWENFLYEATVSVQKYRRCIVQFDMGIIIFSRVSFAVLQMYTSIVSVSNYCLGTRFAYRYN